MDIYRYDCVGFEFLASTQAKFSECGVLMEKFKTFKSELSSLHKWSTPANSIERLLIDASCETFVKDAPLPEFTLINGMGRSRTIKVEELATSKNLFVKRANILGNSPKAAAFDLKALFPLAEEMKLSFFPQSLPTKLKKLILRVKEDVNDPASFKNLFPTTLRVLKIRVDSFNPKTLITSFVEELLKLRNLRVLEIHFADPQTAVIKRLVRFSI